jgi:hypothetical protein
MRTFLLSTNIARSGYPWEHLEKAVRRYHVRLALAKLIANNPMHRVITVSPSY